MYKWRARRSFKKAKVSFWSSLAVFWLGIAGAFYSFMNMLTGFFYIGASISERRRWK